MVTHVYLKDGYPIDKMVYFSNYEGGAGRHKKKKSARSVESALWVIMAEKWSYRGLHYRGRISKIVPRFISATSCEPYTSKNSRV